MRTGQVTGRLALLRVGAGDQHPRHACGFGSLNHLCGIFGKLGAGKVDANIKHGFSKAKAADRG
jgi:hypothetical protein